MDFQRILKNRLVLAATTWAAVCLGLVGCNSGLPLFDPVVDTLWPYAEKDQTTLRTPAERLEALEQLARDASSYDAKRQHEVSFVLSQQFRDESDPLIRRQLVVTLSQYPTDDAAAVLHQALTDAHPEVRIATCEALAKRGGAAALAALDTALREDKDLDVRLAAARWLGEFPDQGAVAALGGALENSDPAMQYMAVQSLKKVTGANLGNDVNAWRQFVKTGRPPTTKNPTNVAERLRNLYPF